MNRFVNRKSIVSLIIALTLAVAFVGGVALHGGTTATRAASTVKNPICSRLDKSIQASAGVQMYCFGPQVNGPTRAKTVASSTFAPNVDAANPHEDIAPNGTQSYGQSEVSVAGTAKYTVEAWNDATGFFSPCPSPKFKEELTGFGFSADGGRTFTDEGGLPNDCTTGFFYEGDPTVETWQHGGATYFYVGSLYINVLTGQSDLAMDACKASGTGSSASIACAGPFIVATGGPGDFLDKEFLSIDPQRGRLYMSYTRFGPPTNPATFNGQIELALCDISSPLAPVCYPGASPAPYLVVAPGNANCENEGAYPAVDIKRGDVYVAWEFNWASSFFNPACFTVHVKNKVAYVPFACLTPTPVSPCVTTPLTKAVNIDSLSASFIPGYNRFPANDFPRIAVSDPYGTVTIVWNDTRFHPNGDILLQSWALVSLSYVQKTPVRINPDTTGGLHFLPALRQAQASGLIDVSYYQRDIPNTDTTNVDALINLSPRTTGPGSRTRVTSVPSAWIDTSSDIIPNFGDYTDNYVQSISQSPYFDDTLYVAWSDGRLGDPQPFEAHGIS